MKALRCLLATFAVLTVISVSAQSLAQDPSVQFQSTSSMVGSGSTLPQAAQTGAYTTYDIDYPGAMGKPGIKRIGGSGSGTEGNEAEESTDPSETPIGDGVWVLLAFAAGYAVYCIRRKCVKELKS